MLDEIYIIVIYLFACLTLELYIIKIYFPRVINRACGNAGLAEIVYSVLGVSKIHVMPFWDQLLNPLDT